MVFKKKYGVGLSVGIVIIVLCAILFLHPFTAPGSREVVIYTSVDQVYSEPVLKEFENRTGIRVLPVYDVEAAKTTGLVNRLIAEKNNPRADIFWSGEIVQTMLLEQEGVLEPYDSPAATGIPPQYRDAGGFWTGFGGRARVILVSTHRLGNTTPPHSIFDFLNDRYPAGSIGIAYPMFGTAATHAAALYAGLGDAQARAFFTGLRTRGVRVVDGNSVVRDLISSGQLAFGLVDTDDACGAIERGDAVVMVVPDQGEGELGTLIIPNTVALIADGPHRAEARMLADYLLSQTTEEALVRSGWIQVPIRSTGASPSCLGGQHIRGMSVNYTTVYPSLIIAQQDLREIFIR